MAFSRIKSDRVILKIYGSGNDEFKKMVEDDNRIQFCGIYDESELGNIFSKVDLLIVPSIWHENRPQVITEALACRLPVLSSNALGIEQITDGVNGFTFRLGETGHLTGKLKKILANPEILNNIKAEIKNRAVLTAEKEAIEYEKAYKKVLD